MVSRTGRTIGILFGLAGLLALSAGVWLAFAGKGVLLRASADAEVLTAKLSAHRDADGLLIFRTEAAFRYSVAGRDYTSSAQSDAQSSNYAHMVKELQKYAPGTRHKVYYEESSPANIRFGVSFVGPESGRALLLSAVGLGLCGLGWACWRRLGPPLFCSKCKKRIKPTYRFCPFCDEAAPPSG